MRHPQRAEGATRRPSPPRARGPASAARAGARVDGPRVLRVAPEVLRFDANDYSRDRTSSHAVWRSGSRSARSPRMPLRAASAPARASAASPGTHDRGARARRGAQGAPRRARPDRGAAAPRSCRSSPRGYAIVARSEEAAAEMLERRLTILEALVGVSRLTRRVTDLPNRGGEFQVAAETPATVASKLTPRPATRSGSPGRGEAAGQVAKRGARKPHRHHRRA